MRTFFIRKNYFFKKFSPFYLLLLIIISLALVIQSINGLTLFKSEIAKASGASYYVDGASIGGTCNNNNPGTITQPWCTIQKATSSSSSVAAGDTIYVRAGTYAGTVDFYKSGTNSNPITLTAYQNETVNIAGELRIDPNAIDGYLAENWTFSKLNITNPNRDGIHITNGNHTGTITIDNNNISHNKANGIVTGWGNHNIGTIIIKNNTIQYNDNAHQDGNNGIQAYAFGTYIIQNNNISYNGDVNRTSAGNKGVTFYTGTNKCSNCLIENNIFQNNLETGMDFRGNNGVIRNNLFLGNGQLDTEAEEYGDDGLSVQDDSSNNKIYNNIIASSGGYELSAFGNNNEYYNNTIYKDYNYTATPVPSSHYYSAIMVWTGSGNIFRNNVVTNMLNISGRQYVIMVKEFDPVLYTNQTWSNNLYYSSFSNSNYIKINNYPNLAALQTLNQDQNSLFAEPQFVNGAGHDFHVQPSSQAVDHGYSLAGLVNNDYDNVSRPWGLAYDMGAYEYVSAAPQVPTDPILQSSTHPDESSWYNTATVSLGLASGSGANHYHYLVDQNQTSSISALANGVQDTDGSFNVTLAGDGIWYIHIVAHDANHNPSNNYDTYAVHYDATAPTGATISFTNITSSSITVNVSGAADATSGLHVTEPYYFENLTNNINSGWQTGTSWQNNNLNSSTAYQYKVKVKDKAGNILEVTNSQSTASGSTNSNTNTNTNTNTNSNTNSNSNGNVNQSGNGGGGGGGSWNNNNNSNSNSNSNVNQNNNQATDQEGRLVKTASSPAIYYLSETTQKRYVFPDEKVYFSWYNDFSAVQTISSAEMQNYAMGGNVTVRPGSRLVKITSDPKVYAIEPGGVLRWIQTEQIFYALGYKFSMVVDVPEILFQGYSIGQPIINASRHPQGVIFKYPNSPTVYYWDGLQKRAIESEAAFIANRWDWNNLLIVPESLQYNTGSPISGEEIGLVLNW